MAHQGHDILFRAIFIPKSWLVCVTAIETACESDEPHFLQSVEIFYDKVKTLVQISQYFCLPHKHVRRSHDPSRLKAASISNVSQNTLAHIKAVDSVLSVTFPIEVRVLAWLM